MPQIRSRLDKYGRTPTQLLRNPDLSPRAKLLYAIADEVSGREPAPLSRLSVWMGCTKRTVQRAVDELEKSGWLEVLRGEYDPKSGWPENVYIVNDVPFSNKKVEDEWWT